MTQIILQQSPSGSALGSMTKMQLLSRVVPVTGAVAFLFALIWEPGAYSHESLLRPGLIEVVLLVSLACTVMQYAEWKLVHMLSFVAFNVLATVHQIPIVLAGVVMRHDVVGVHAAIGFGTCIIGALLYAAERRGDTSMEPEPPEPCA